MRHPMRTASMRSTIKSVLRSASSSIGGSPIRCSPRICLISGSRPSDQRLSFCQSSNARLLPIGCLVAPSVKALDDATVKHVETPAARYPPDHLVELFRLLAVFAARCVKAGWESLGVQEHRRPLASIKRELAVVLRQPDGLEPARLVPDEGTDVLQPPRIQQTKRHRQELVCRPHPDVTVISRRDFQSGQLRFAHGGIIEGGLVGANVAFDLLHRPRRIEDDDVIDPFGSLYLLRGDVFEPGNLFLLLRDYAGAGRGELALFHLLVQVRVVTLQPVVALDCAPINICQLRLLVAGAGGLWCVAGSFGRRYLVRYGRATSCGSTRRRLGLSGPWVADLVLLLRSFRPLPVCFFLDASLLSLPCLIVLVALSPLDVSLVGCKVPALSVERPCELPRVAPGVDMLEARLHPGYLARLHPVAPVDDLPVQNLDGNTQSVGFDVVRQLLKANIIHHGKNVCSGMRLHHAAALHKRTV